MARQVRGVSASVFAYVTRYFYCGLGRDSSG